MANGKEIYISFYVNRLWEEEADVTVTIEQDGEKTIEEAFTLKPQDSGAYVRLEYPLPTADVSVHKG